MNTEIKVCIDLQGIPYLVGSLLSRSKKTGESSTFEYKEDGNYLLHLISIRPLVTSRHRFLQPQLLREIQALH